MEIKKNLFRATLSQVPDIGDIIIGYQDEAKNGDKILLKIVEKTRGLIIKVERFEAGKYKVIFRDS